MGKKHDSMKQVRLWPSTRKMLLKYREEYNQKAKDNPMGPLGPMSLTFLVNSLIANAIRTMK